MLRVGIEWSSKFWRAGNLLRPPSDTVVDVIIAPEQVELVSQLLRDAASRFVLPHVATRPEAYEKSVGEVITSVDLATEAFLVEALPTIVPVRIIGEESAAANPSICVGLATDSYWIVDPLDGTANFANGTDDYAMMIALVDSGEAVGSWIYRPATDAMCVAIRDRGATRNNEPIQIATTMKPTSELRGDVLTRFLPDETKQSVADNRSKFELIGAGTKCAGVDYPAVLDGSRDFLVYWRVLPWDHTPGVLLIEEAGGCVQRLDGGRYQPSMTEQGLLVASSPLIGEQIRHSLLGLR